MIALVGCGKSKRAHAAPARDLYTGNLFRKSLAYAEASRAASGTLPSTCPDAGETERRDVYIISAKHGLLELDQVVEPYEQSLQGVAPYGRLEWARGVWRALAERHDLRTELQSVLVLAGELYADPLLDAAVDLSLNVELLVPLQGMQIGQRLSFLSSAETSSQTEQVSRRSA